VLIEKTADGDCFMIGTEIAGQRRADVEMDQPLECEGD
jgi:hypothetical protein